MAKAKTTGPAPPRKMKGKESGTRQIARAEVDLGSLIPPPANLMRRFRNELERVFEEFGIDDLGQSLPGPESLGLGTWLPEVEVFERENEIVIRADLPGLTQDEIKIDLTDKLLSIEGERKQEKRNSGNGYYRSERNYGHFSRQIPLPEGADTDTALAEFHDGVLEVTLARAAAKEQKVRKLEIGAVGRVRAAVK